MGTWLYQPCLRFGGRGSRHADRVSALERLMADPAEEEEVHLGMGTRGGVPLLSTPPLCILPERVAPHPHPEAPGQVYQELGNTVRT